MISAVLRKGDDPRFIAEELGAVHSVHDTAWIRTGNGEKSTHFTSLIAYIGYILGQYIGTNPSLRGSVMEPRVEVQDGSGTLIIQEKCPQCLAPALVRKEGCKTCMNCGYSDCA
jgi:ribonucleoside-diphosphate reductase alpha chain